MKIQLKRAYELRDKHDGARLLVERLWPRGLSRLCSPRRMKSTAAPWC